MKKYLTTIGLALGIAALLYAGDKQGECAAKCAAGEKGAACKDMKACDKSDKAACDKSKEACDKADKKSADMAKAGDACKACDKTK